MFITSFFFTNLNLIMVNHQQVNTQRNNFIICSNCQRLMWIEDYFVEAFFTELQFFSCVNLQTWQMSWFCSQWTHKHIVIQAFYITLQMNLHTVSCESMLYYSKFNMHQKEDYHPADISFFCCIFCVRCFPKEIRSCLKCWLITLKTKSSRFSLQKTGDRIWIVILLAAMTEQHED